MSSKLDLLEKIKKAGLLGRGGGCFEVAKKWQMVKEAQSDRKFIVCNLSEGEPGVKKDKHILEYHMSEALSGIRLAMDYLEAERAYIYINPRYYDEFQYRLRKLIGESNIELFKKDHKAGYIAGEETAALNHIEGKKVEPRLRPPFPTSSGLWGHPTLVNNLETFYNVFLVSEDCFEAKRFITIGGDCLDRGVFAFPEKETIAEILRATKNYPKFDFFVQVGGDASGLVLSEKQLDSPVVGSGSITVYSKLKHKPLDLIRGWALYFRNESCGQCTPCREGTLRLVELLYAKEPDWEMCGDILDNLSESSFCSLGLSVPLAIRSYINNVLSEMPDNRITFPNASNQEVCGCLR
jgi:NADH:ubiquinone oxidoreductase subunit F (NADH-binding)